MLQKNLLCTLAITLLFFCGQLAYSKSDSPASADITLMSYNIRTGHTFLGDNTWDKRKVSVAKMINSIKPDLIGLQEAIPYQTDFLLKKLPGFVSVGIPRNGEDSESVNILVSTERFTILDSGTFWLSPTPEKKSRAWRWRAYIHRICTWVLLQDKLTTKKFYFYNVHFDHSSSKARKNSALLLLEKIHTRKVDAPVILGGDLNTEPGSKTINLLLSPYKEKAVLKSTLELSQKDNNSGTFNGFEDDLDDNPPKKIDYIFVSEGITSGQTRVYQQKIDGRFPSDHFPISIRFEVN